MHPCRVRILQGIANREKQKKGLKYLDILDNQLQVMNIGRITAAGLMPVLCPNAAAHRQRQQQQCQGGGGRRAQEGRLQGHERTTTETKSPPLLTCKSEGGGTVLLSLSLSASPLDVGWCVPRATYVMCACRRCSPIIYTHSSAGV